MIEPKIPKGFRDSLPEMEIKRRRLEGILEHIFQSYGFLPIDTPVVEYTEVLLGKGGGETDKQIFHFVDNGGREVALRFDLTVPLARFIAAHQAEISFPFKRYAIAKVFRGEKPQKGRYREFKQCDFDIVGADNTASDFEILSMMNACLTALNVGGFKIHFSSRALLNDFLQSREIGDKNLAILRAIDKLRKIGMEKVTEELLEEGLTQQNIDDLLLFIQPNETDLNAVLNTLVNLIGKTTDAAIRMKEIISLLEETSISENFIFDPSITRGLDYYTGIVFETFLDKLPEIGSVCSGGRYDNLTGLYSKEKFPGVGSSVGMDRLIAAKEEIQKSESSSTMVDCVILNTDSSTLVSNMKMASSLRSEGLSVDVYLGNKKINQQYTYAQTKGATWAMLGSDLKNLETREVFSGLSASEIALKIKG